MNECLSYDGALFKYVAGQSPSDTAYGEDGSLKWYCGAYPSLYGNKRSSNVLALNKAFNTVKLTYNIWSNQKLREKIPYDYACGVEGVLWYKPPQTLHLRWLSSL